MNMLMYITHGKQGYKKVSNVCINCMTFALSVDRQGVDIRWIVVEVGRVMSNWIATNELRFEARKVYDYNPKGRVIRILQQRWEKVISVQGIASQKVGEEWRDVPVVEEEE
jgi:hypothetical protein